MSKGQRILVFLVLITILFIVYFAYIANFSALSDKGVLLMSALIMLAFTILFVEHYFTRPTDVVASTIAILLLLSPLHEQLSRMGKWYWIFWGYNAFLLVVALLSLLLIDVDRPETSWQNRAARALKIIAIRFGNGKSLWFALFVLSLLFYVDSQSNFFLVLFLSAAVILLINPQKAILDVAKLRGTDLKEVARIFGVQTGNVYLARQLKQSAPVPQFGVVGFRPNIATDNSWKIGIVLDTYMLNNEYWLRILTDPAIKIPNNEITLTRNLSAGSVYRLDKASTVPMMNRLVGVVCEHSTIERLRFEYAFQTPIQEGDLLEIRIGAMKVLYQIIEGITKTELLRSNDEAGVIIGEAVQLGVWNLERRCFERYGWVPNMNTAVFLCEDIEPPEPREAEFKIGTIPGTNFPVFINLEAAVTYHIAVLGVTGSGKSVFSRNLIRQITKQTAKIICVDFTNEYKQQLSDLINDPLITGECADSLFKAVDAIGIELDKFPNQRNLREIDKNEKMLKKGFSQALRSFIQSGNPATLFELPDVTNSTSILEYTRWFFRSLFDLARNGDFDNCRLCVVLEEAHTIVPEWNFLGVDNKRSSSVVNSIAQIALQGRKYGVGFIVIAQRTANVSKTVLTQCNSVVAFQQFDKTSADFLANYMGDDFISSLARLKPRHAIAVGKAFSSGTPVIFEVPEIIETNSNNG